MKLPHPDRAVVDVAKVRNYLLSDSHTTGRFKAAVFRTLGYSADHWETLAQELRRHAEENDAIEKEANEYGAY